MATRALWVFLMREQTLVGGEHLASKARDRRHIRGRGRRRVVEQLAQHPGTAFDGAGVLTIAAHEVDGRHAEQPAARRAFGQRHLFIAIALHAREAVVMREHAIDHYVIGLQQVAQARVVPQLMLDGFIDFTLDRDLRAVVEARIQRAIDLEEVDAIQAEPLMGEGADETL